MDIGDDELLEVDGVDAAAGSAPALAPAERLRGIAAHRPGLPVLAQAAVLAGAGFAAGTVTAAVVRSARRRGALGPRRRHRALPHTKVVATRSFLIDVHVLETRDR